MTEIENTTTRRRFLAQAGAVVVATSVLGEIPLPAPTGDIEPVATHAMRWEALLDDGWVTIGHGPSLTIPDWLDGRYVRSVHEAWQ